MDVRFPLPVVSFEEEPFWTGGGAGQLRIMRCRACGWWIHPPRPVCRRCRSTDVAPEAVSGQGTVYSYTVNHQRWAPGLDVPYVLAVVELIEQAGLRLTTRLVDPPEDLAIGDRAEVRFEQVADDVWLPLFAVARDPGSPTSP
ncbi:MAG: OB-fold domain-containing protein [Actinomycetota bacterium]